ncbi:MAG: IS1 family transposase [Magnetococcales bacterium]|nr:IS1 family transposase [Magnetococcales bacterium]
MTMGSTSWSWTRGGIFSKKTNKLWIWKAYCRDTGQLVDWECDGRDRATFRRLRDRVIKWNDVFCADHWDAYHLELPEDVPLVQSKAETFAIENNNGRQRHWFARFRRKTVVVSKTREMVDLTMSLFARFHVNGDIENVVSLFRLTIQKSIVGICYPRARR